LPRSPPATTGKNPRPVQYRTANLLPIAFRSFSEARTETRDRLPPEINTDIGESFRILFRIFDFYSDNSASEKHK